MKINKIQSLDELEDSNYYFDLRNKFLGKGKESRVYPMGEFAVKIRYNALTGFEENIEIINELIEEYNIGFELHSEGVSIPKPENILLVNSSKLKKYPGYFMELLEKDYKKLNFVESKYRNRATELFEAEMHKVEQIGFIAHESTYKGNIMYSSLRDDLKIIDVSKYERIK